NARSYERPLCIERAGAGRANIHRPERSAAPAVELPKRGGTGHAGGSRQRRQRRPLALGRGIRVGHDREDTAGYVRFSPKSGRGTVIPSALVVLRFRNISTFVDCWTGRSAAFSPLRMRPV